MQRALQRPWLVAAWPGMGGVALLGAKQLHESLDMQVLSVLDAQSHFDVERVQVSEGLVRPALLPQSRVHVWRDPEQRRDLAVLTGEAQPSWGMRGYITAVLDEAERLGVTRVITFAALGTPVDPRAPARVFAASTNPALLAEARAAGALPLADGAINGLNGVFIAAALERGLEGLCLLGEFPYYAGSVPNPKASAAILRVFAKLAGLRLELGALETEAARVEQLLAEHFAQLERSVSERLQADDDEQPGEDYAALADEQADPDLDDDATPPAAPPAEPQPELPAQVRERIERLFEQAAEDRDKALELKAELDRLGLFERYEGRFLDLFRQAD